MTMQKLMVAMALATGAAMAFGDTWTDPSTGIKWTYKLSGDNASVGGGSGSSPAVPKTTEGALVIPAQIDGHTVTALGNYAFRYCNKLTGISIPSSVTSIGNYAFQGCTELASLDIPEGVETIKQYLCNGCSALAHVTIPSTVKTINGSAFYNCTALKSLDIPEGVTSMGSYIITCSGVTNIVIPSTMTSVGLNTFNGAEHLESVTIPSSVTTIGENAFLACRALKTVKIPENVTTIGVKAFYKCAALTSAEIPSTVTTIGYSAFDSCTSLTNVIFNGNAPSSVGSAPFYNVAADCTATVYKDATGWTVDAEGKWNGLIVVYRERATDPIPDIGANPTQQQIADALNGSADPRLTECITNGATYNAYRDWAIEISGGSSEAQAVKDSPHAWLSFALACDELIAEAPVQEDVTIDGFEAAASGKYELTVGVKDIVAGDGATAANLATVFGIAGGQELESLSSDNVEITTLGTEGGKVTITAGPNAANASATNFFMRATMIP